jgi:hypothetical protein
MKSKIISASVLSLFFLSSCATIVSKSNWPVTVNTNPQGMDFVVSKTSTSEFVSQGKTPQQVILKSGSGYFKPESYRFDLKKGSKTIASQEITAGFNGWYVGNIVFGGLIGLVIVDPLTGAMYKFPESINLIVPSIASVDNNGRTLKFVAIENLTSEQRKQLVKI